MELKYGKAANKAAAASTAETIRFNESDIPGGEAVRSFILNMTGTARDFDAIDSIVVKAGGSQIWNVNELQHAALMQFISKKTGPGATDTRFQVPFWWGAPNVAFPRGKAAAVEIAIDNTPSATGVVGLAYSYLDPAPKADYYPMYIASDCNIAASASNARYPVTQPGFLRGFCLPDTGDITSVRIYVQNQLKLDLDLAQLLEAQELEQGGTVSTNRFFSLPAAPKIVPGETFIELTVAAGFGGATEDIAIYCLVPQGTI